ncbi:hypothetical protein KJ628_04250 [Patescibacteria group bacterium]|nr:hypothetical protein [Patescibacteria group bacterium]
MRSLDRLAIIDQKPYLTKRELALLWNKRGKNLDNKVQTLLGKGELISLKNGLYVTKTYLQRQLGNIAYVEFIANILYYPSYLSLEYVLQKENIIPEAIYDFTSITNKTTRRYQNKLGSFSYRSLKPELFIGYREIGFNGSHMIKIATKTKALFDWLYLKTFTISLSQELKFDLRINWELFDKNDVIEFGQYAAVSQVKKMNQIYKIISQEVK